MNSPNHIKKATSIFDIVKKLNPFAGVRKDKIRPEENPSSGTARGLLDTDR